MVGVLLMQAASVLGETRLRQKLVRCQFVNKDKAVVVSQGLRHGLNLSPKTHYVEIPTLSALNVALFGVLTEKSK